MSASAVASRLPLAPPWVAPAAPALSLHLRQATREGHVAAEAAFELETRLASRGAYAGLLADLRGFYRPVEATLAAVPGWSQLTPAIEIQTRRRAALIDDDLRLLAPAPRHAEAEIEPPCLPSLAHALGCLYVLEGSALGGRMVTRRARAALGDDLPVAFLSSAGRDDLRADWRALQATLDAFGAGPPDARRRAAVASASATFTALAAWLDSSRGRR